MALARLGMVGFFLSPPICGCSRTNRGWHELGVKLIVPSHSDSTSQANRQG